MQRVFEWSSLLVMPFWALMVFLPRARLTERLMRWPLGPLLPALVYLALLLPRVGDVLPAVMRPELSGLSALLATPEGTTLAWAHFLAFDLFVGRWIYLDARERGVSPLLTAPVLFLTLMVGPVGLVAYLVVRALAARPAQGVVLAKEVP
ncbi:MAG: DUF4281 domain-containing protein [Myxococcaceae bacterium]|nr:DUF4281 domain-containing protein [Myxococcaceae bacterium]MCI0670180.1 DUF4281 domain-containing protein [Myxococcaceae bacterium]